MGASFDDITLTLVASHKSIDLLEQSVRDTLPHCFHKGDRPQITTRLSHQLRGTKPQVVITGPSMNTDKGLAITAKDIIDYVRGQTGEQTPVIVLHAASANDQAIYHDGASVELKKVLELPVALRAVLNLPLA